MVTVGEMLAGVTVVEDRSWNTVLQGFEEVGERIHPAVLCQEISSHAPTGGLSLEVFKAVGKGLVVEDTSNRIAK